MAAGKSKFHLIIILIACCLTLYIVVGSLESLYYTKSSNQEQETTDGGKTQDIALLRDKVEHLESLVNRLENSFHQVSNVRNGVKQSQKLLPGSTQTNTIVEQLASLSPSTSPSPSLVIAIETVNNQIKPDIDEGPIYNCPDEEEDDFVENNLSLFGKPVYAKNKTIMYVTMPKCGSRTLIWTVIKLRKFHHFGKPLNLPYMLADNSPSEMRTYFHGKLGEAEDGAVIHGQYRFIDMNDSPKNPILISLIRDPVDRFVSRFYFMRHGDRDIKIDELIKKIGRRSSGALPNETIDDCVEKDRDECTSSLLRNFYTTSFCGYGPKCSQFPKYALEQAKLNVDKFLVIGLVEEYDLTMAIFDKLLPETFGGAAKIYRESRDESMQKFETSYKKLPSPKTYSILKRRMQNDYEFYEYVKKRLHKVAKSLGIGSCSRLL